MKRTLLRKIDPDPFVPSDPKTLSERCRFILRIMTIGLAQRLLAVEKATGSRKTALALSGGRDSVLAFLVTVLAYDYLGWDRQEIKVITLPGVGTTDGTKAIAIALPKALGTAFMQAEIEEIAAGILRAAGHEPCWNCLQCENAQARVRTNITMAIGFMIGTGDMSEAFRNWCTYAGDQISMYNTNCGVPKTLVNFLIKQVAIDNIFGDEVSKQLDNTLALEITPELIKAEGDAIVQKTEELIGPYRLNDFDMLAIIRNGFPPRKIFWLAYTGFRGIYDPSVIIHWLKDGYKRFYAGQFKRDAMPNGIKVGTLSLDPRGDWRMPSDAAVPTSILDELALIEKMIQQFQEAEDPMSKAEMSNNGFANLPLLGEFYREK